MRARFERYDLTSSDEQLYRGESGAGANLKYIVLAWAAVALGYGTTQAAGLVGGLGFAPSANMGDKYAVFEPTHGSAPKYAGQYKVNPHAMLLTAKMMLDWLGDGHGGGGSAEKQMAARLESAVARVITSLVSSNFPRGRRCRPKKCTSGFGSSCRT